MWPVVFIVVAGERDQIMVVDRDRWHPNTTDPVSGSHSIRRTLSALESNRMERLPQKQKTALRRPSPCMRCNV